ncbi:hypothetical protein V8C34DRAFT_245757 [Trichoderma compactum]
MTTFLKATRLDSARQRRSSRCRLHSRSYFCSRLLYILIRGTKRCIFTRFPLLDLTSLSLSSLFVFLYSAYRPLTTPFCARHHLYVVAATRAATIADLVFVVGGLAPETWQDIGNAQGCLYMRNHGFMVASSYFWGSSKKLVYTLRRSLYKKERGSVEEIPTNLKSELHDGPSCRQ